MREHLIGYLLNALDPDEHAQVELQLQRDPQLQRELDHISRLIAPLEYERAAYEPPAGLTERTCRFVAAQMETTLAPATTSTSRWSMADLVVAAGIFLAATLLFFPAVSQSRFAARVNGCQNNLRQIGAGLASYSMLHQGFFPSVAPEGRLSVAGVYAAKLIEQGHLQDPAVVICPASKLADDLKKYRVPTLGEMDHAGETELVEMQRLVGGSYGYNLGYLVDGRYHPPKNRQRPTFAIVADAPVGDSPHFSANHNRCGQNVLFEDGHVDYLTSCKARGCRDEIYLNDKGQVAAGLHVHDSVIGASHAKPLAANKPMEMLKRPAK